MGYLHINNLYKDDRIFQFPECYALEKIHGTSAHVTFKFKDKKPEIIFFSGGESYENFKNLFVENESCRKLVLFINENTLDDGSEVVVFGEAYGGKQQGMSGTYGKQLKFIAFDVKFCGKWLNVPEAELLCSVLDIEFVHYVKIPTFLSAIDEERAKPSIQAARNGILEPKEREGIVLRPLSECYDSWGDRVITKHKNDAFKETKTQRQVDPTKLQILTDAKMIADEWVTEMRLQHVIDKSGVELIVENTPIIIRAMIEDIRREATGEILESKEAMKQIGSATARLFKRYLNTLFQEIYNVHPM